MAPPTGNQPLAKPTSAPASSTVDVLLGAAACWYLTGLLAALAFSLGFYLVRPAPGIAGEDREFSDAFTWMDGKWYKQIATEGYRYDPKARSNIAFFPLYPLLGRAVMAVTGLGAEWALLIVSNLSFLAALGLLALYVRGRPVGQAFQPDGLVNDDAARASPTNAATLADLAEWSVLAAALFPTGCFFRLVYSESTFFLFLVLSMLGMQRRWPVSSIAFVVGLATAARPVGVALLAPFAFHLLRHSYVARHHFGSALARMAVYLPLACWGLLGFMAYQYCAFGEPLAMAKAQDHWSIRPAAPWSEKMLALATLEPIRAVYENPSPAFWASSDLHGMPWLSLQFANPLLFLAGVVLVALGACRRWLSLEEVTLAALLLVIPYLTRAYEMGMGSYGGADQHQSAGLPPDVERALRASAERLAGLELRGYYERGLLGDPSETLKALGTLEPQPEFCQRVSFRFRLADRRLHLETKYPPSKFTPADSTNERAFDGEKLYMGSAHPVGGVAPGVLLIHTPQTLMTAERQGRSWGNIFDFAYLHAAGFEGPQGSAELGTPLRSLVLDKIARGSLVSTATVTHEGRQLFEVLLRFPDPWMSSRQTDIESDPSLQLKDQESTAFQQRVEKERRQLTAATRMARFTLDPSLNYAVVRIEETRDQSGVLMFVTQNRDFADAGGGLQLPRLCEVTSYAYETRPAFSTKVPAFVTTVKIEEIGRREFAQEDFKVWFDVPGLTVEDFTKASSQPDVPVAYRVPGPVVPLAGAASAWSGWQTAFIGANVVLLVGLLFFVVRRRGRRTTGTG